jgi:hypothetical protein
MKYELGSELKELVDCLYADFEWYDYPAWTKVDIKHFKLLVKDLNEISRKLK